jgi:hypothetical protein
MGAVDTGERAEAARERMTAAERRLAALREAQHDIQERILALRSGDGVGSREVLERARLAAEGSAVHARFAALRAAEADDAAARLHAELAARGAGDVEQHRRSAEHHRRSAVAHRAIAARLAPDRAPAG